MSGRERAVGGRRDVTPAAGGQFPVHNGPRAAHEAAWRPAVLVAVATLAIGLVLAQTVTTFTLKRDDTDLVISNRSLAIDGARSIGNNLNCEDGVRMTVVFGPRPGHVETQVEDALLTSQLAIVRTPREAEEGEEQETLELSDDSVTFSRPGCPEELIPAASPQVTLVQGRTTVHGSRFFLDREVDSGVMDGPITLLRAPEETGGAELHATSMSFAVGKQQATLTGAVVVTSEDRVTTGETLELDEEAGTAILTGSPARSVRGQDVLQGNRLLYYLDSDDVVVLGNVFGELELDLSQ